MNFIKSVHKVQTLVSDVKFRYRAGNCIGQFQTINKGEITGGLKL